MPKRVDRVLVVGGGSAGFLAALTLKRMAPGIAVQLVRSLKIPVIGVGESTTAAFPKYLHGALGLDRREFYAQVRPSWKLGIRFIWGDPAHSHFYYPFDSRMDFRRPDLPRPDGYFCVRDQRDATPYTILMDRGAGACYLRQGRYMVDEGFGYHIDNEMFLAFLEKVAARVGIDVLDGDVADVARSENGDIAHLRLEDGRELTADLFIDCTGFRSLLLGKTLGTPYLPYTDSLFCDSAVVGEFRRSGPILPYTTAETMDHGWCWRIEFEDHVTRGYVYSSQFCSVDQAMQEMKHKNPELGDDLWTLKFPSGRYQDYWVGNVAAIGNASGFVEPLESTALHMVTEQLRFLCQALMECNRQMIPAMRQLQNRRFRQLWDDVRAFLAIHYRFNRWYDTPFWRHCRQDVELATAQPIVEFYQQAGPSPWMRKLLDDSMFGFTGYVTLLMGQRLATAFDPELTDEHWRTWEAHRDRLRRDAGQALSMRQALERINGPEWNWG